jgi:hypothetical protein
MKKKGIIDNLSGIEENANLMSIPDPSVVSSKIQNIDRNPILKSKDKQEEFSNTRSYEKVREIIFGKALKYVLYRC